MTTIPCPACGSLACAVQSPKFCRTLNVARPDAAVVEESPAASPAPVTAGTSRNRSKR